MSADAFLEIGPQVVTWQALWMPNGHTGIEFLEIEPGSAQGSIVGYEDEAGPFRIEYRVAWDERWRTTDVEVALSLGSGVQRLTLEQRGGAWRDGDGRELEDLRGCLDVDIWPTPFTNTLPIRRLRLANGDARMIDVAYVDAIQPRVSRIERVQQAYERTGSRTFHFGSVRSGFVADLTVDDHGLVLEYPGLFSRLGAAEDGARV